MPKLNEQLEGLNFSNMIYEKQTFDEFIQNPSNKIGIRQRIKRLKQYYFDELDKVLIKN